MTIICYRDGVMASDSSCFGGETTILGSMQKVVRTQEGVLIGTAGRSSLCERFQNWATGAFTSSNGMRDFGIKGYPHFEARDEGGKLAAIVVVPSGKVILYYEQGNPITILRDDFYTCGAAEDIALGALMMGADAEQAVAICIKRHCLAAGDIQIAYLRDIDHELASRRKL